MMRFAAVLVLIVVLFGGVWGDPIAHNATATAVRGGAGRGVGRGRHMNHTTLLWQHYSPVASFQSTINVLTNPNTVFFIGNRHVYAYDMSTGSPRWVFKPEMPRNTGNAGAVLVGNRTLAVLNNGNLLGIDTVSGALRWQYQPNTMHPDRLLTTSFAPPIVYDGAGGNPLVLYTVNDELVRAVAVDSVTGQLAWNVTVGSDGFCPQVTLYKHTAIAAAANTIVAVDARTGQKLWRLKGVVAVKRGALLADSNGILYFGMEDSHGRFGVGALRIADRTVLWTRSASKYDVIIDAGMAVVDGVLVVAQASVYGLNATTGTVLWQDGQVGDMTVPYIHPIGGTVYFSTAYTVNGVNAANGVTTFCGSVGNVHFDINSFAFQGDVLAVATGVGVAAFRL